MEATHLQGTEAQFWHLFGGLVDASSKVPISPIDCPRSTLLAVLEVSPGVLLAESY
jgi:hypothetical protein